MNAGIFAAGEGRRLKDSWPGIIKPMVPVDGRPLIEWSVRLLAESGCGDITILLNSRGKPAMEHLARTFSDRVQFCFILQDTASSWESFRLLAKALSLKSDSFIMSTVDTLYDPRELSAFCAGAREKYCDAVLALSHAGDDEKPLFADTNENGLITRFGSGCVDKKYATSGLYWMTSKLADAMPEAVEHAALREYLAALAERGRRMGFWRLTSSVDVDDMTDVALAEQFIKSRIRVKEGAI